MSRLQVFLFGQVCVEHTACERSGSLSRTGQALLAYFLLKGDRCHARDVLAGLLWGDHQQDRARRSLNTALWRLRQVLEPDDIPRGTYLVTTTAGEVGFNWDSDYWLDVSKFTTGCMEILNKPIAAMSPDQASALERALQLYNADLMDGFYADWVLSERERLRQLHLKGQIHLMQYYSSKADFAKSIAYGREILNQEPLREEIHRDLMRYYVANGQRTLAVQQYERCREILAQELGIPPMPETRALIKQVTQDPFPSEISSTPEPETYHNEALHQLQLAVKNFDEARLQLDRAMNLVERLLKR